MSGTRDLGWNRPLWWPDLYGTNQPADLDILEHATLRPLDETPTGEKHTKKNAFGSGTTIPGARSSWKSA